MLNKLVLLVVLTACWTLAPADSQGLTISDFLIKSGAEKQLEGMPISLKIGLRKALARAPNPDKKAQLAFKRVESAIDKAYNKDKMMGLLQQRVKDAFSPDELKTMNSFLESHLGKRFTEAENKMAEEKEIDNIMQNSTEILKEANKNPERLKVIQSLIETDGAIEKAVDSALDTSLATQIALFNATPGRETPPMEVLEKNVEQQRFTIRGMMTQLILASSVHTYRSFTHAELKEYIAFNVAPVGKKFSKVFSDSFRAVNKQCAKDMGKIAADATKRAGAS